MDFMFQGFPSLPFLFSIIIPVIVLLIFGSVFRFRQRPPFPPGPRGLPLIGNMLMMNQMSHRGLAVLVKRYGGIFHLRIGFHHTVVISSPDIAQNILQVQDKIFSNRPANIAIKYLTYERADMVFAQYGPFWRQMRKLCVMKLFSRNRVKSWASVRDEVDHLIRKVAEKTETSVNIGDLVFKTTMDIIYRAAFGTIEREGQAEFIGIMQEFSKLFSAFNIADFIPFLSWIDLQGLNGRLVKARQSLDRFIGKIIDEHLQKTKEVDTDMVDDLLAFYSEEKESDLEDFQDSIKLTRDNIKAIIMDVMFGGTETIASAIEWTMSELIMNPNELMRVQQELTDVVGLNRRRVEESELEKLTYLKCALKETLRLHPPVPLLLHETTEDSEVAGYYIPAKSRVIINTWAIGRDENSWDEPESYKASRFLKLGVPDFKGSDFEFIPFGSGRRSCPGMQLALYALEMAVAQLLHCFNWELPDGMKLSDLDMNDMFGLTAPRATRLIVVPSKRVICPLV